MTIESRPWVPAPPPICDWSEDPMPARPASTSRLSPPLPAGFTMPGRPAVPAAAAAPGPTSAPPSPSELPLVRFGISIFSTRVSHV